MHFAQLRYCGVCESQVLLILKLISLRWPCLSVTLLIGTSNQINENSSLHMCIYVNIYSTNALNTLQWNPNFKIIGLSVECLGLKRSQNLVFFLASPSSPEPGSQFYLFFFPLFCMSCGMATQRFYSTQKSSISGPTHSIILLFVPLHVYICAILLRKIRVSNIIYRFALKVWQEFE